MEKSTVKKNPLVTVLMAVYNGERFLKPTIDSILSQTFRDFEVLIVNDGSTDGTLDVISSYKDPRIIVRSNRENIGQTKSLNNGETIKIDPKTLDPNTEAMRF